MVEYVVQNISAESTGAATDALNALAHEGWRIVDIFEGTSRSVLTVIFERDLENEEE